MVYNPPKSTIVAAPREIDHTVKALMLIALLEMLYKLDPFINIVKHNDAAADYWVSFSVAFIIVFVASVVAFALYFINREMFAKLAFYLSIVGCFLAFWKMYALYLTIKEVGATVFFADGWIYVALRIVPVIYWPLIAILLYKSNKSYL